MSPLNLFLSRFYKLNVCLSLSRFSHFSFECLKLTLPFSLSLSYPICLSHYNRFLSPPFSIIFCVLNVSHSFSVAPSLTLLFSLFSLSLSFSHSFRLFLSFSHSFSHFLTLFISFSHFLTLSVSLTLIFSLFPSL